MYETKIKEDNGDWREEMRCTCASVCGVWHINWVKRQHQWWNETRISIKKHRKKLIICGGMNECKCACERVCVCETTTISKTVWLIDWLTEQRIPISMRLCKVQNDGKNNNNIRAHTFSANDVTRVVTTVVSVFFLVSLRR